MESPQREGKNSRKPFWLLKRTRLLKMTLEDRRKEYLREHVPLKDIPTWMEEMKSKNQSDDENTEEALQVKKSLSEKVSLYRGDITLLEVDAIVNAGKSLGNRNKPNQRSCLSLCEKCHMLF
uniref:MACD2 deacetylase n=1 Tax=Chelonoidis abingdonii TaxID=106734 RepID=A0A8C0ING2_CHEAB